MSRKPYPSDVSDDEWNFVAPYLTLMTPDAPQREYPLREVFNALRYMARGGEAWRMLPHDFPPWPVVYQQTRRWFNAGVFETMVHDLRAILRLCEGRDPDHTGAVIDSPTFQSTPESGGRARYDGAKKRKGSKVHAAVDTLGHLLALRVTPASAGDREQVDILAEEVQEATGESVEVAYVDQGYTGQDPATDAKQHGIVLQVERLLEAKRGFVLLPKHWVVERSFGWAARVRRLARDYERLGRTLAGFHWIVFACLMLAKAVKIMSQSA